MLAQRKIDGETYTLHERSEVEGWLNLKLERTKRGGVRSTEKRTWYLAWNGERLARNRDGGRLAKEKPEIYQWVLEVLANITPDLIAE